MTFGPNRVVMVGMGWHPDVPGGLNRYFRELFMASRDAGLDASAVTVGPATDAPPQVKVSGTQDEPLAVRAARLAWHLKLAARSARVVDIHFAVYGVIPILLGVKRRKVVVVHFHGPWSAESSAEGRGRGLSHHVKARLEGFVYRRADQLVVLSEAFKRLLIDDFGCDPTRVTVIRPGIDLQAFIPGDRAVARARFEVDAVAWVGVTVRRLVDRVGIDTLIEAWGLLAHQSGGEPLLLIAGTGPSREKLEAQVRQAGMQEEIRFVGGVSEEDLVALYRAADVCVVPTRSLEGFGLVVLEAMACGTPVVGTNVGGLPETIAGLDASLIVPPEAPVALARRLDDAFTGSRPLPSRAAVRAFAERFAWAEVAEAHERTYDDAIRRRHTRDESDHTAESARPS